jgi:hypothetical protein
LSLLSAIVHKLENAITVKGHAVALLVEARKVRGLIPSGVTGIFSLTYSFRPQYGSGLDSVPNRNEYQKYFLGGKAARA